MTPGRFLIAGLVASTLSGFASVSLAQGAAPAYPGMAQMLERLRTADTNGDGMISRDEARTMPMLNKHFDEIDTDKNGLITLQEFEAAMKRMHAMRQGGQLKRLDKDGDGLVSRAEAQAVPRFAQHFDELDSNKDGFLGREELLAAKQRNAERMFARIDKDGDGRISRAEAQPFPRLYRHFDEIDANRDGYLTRDELKAARRQHQAAGGPN